MRRLDADLAACLQGQATTLCRCWLLTRQDGFILGFTDHDCDLTFAGNFFKAASGLDASQFESASGFAIGGGDVDGALTSEAINENDLEAGLYDGANVETWLVDWTAPAQRLLLDVAAIGEVRRTEFAFSAELRSFAHRFDQARGRQYQRCCSAELGDLQCKIDIDSAPFTYAGTILSVTGRSEIGVRLSAPCEDGYFSRGVLRLSGSNKKYAIKSHQLLNQTHHIRLWSAPHVAFSPDEAVALSAGCDKSPAQCQSRFNNIVNFRGFPHLPGNDVLMSSPGSVSVAMDGGSLFR